MGIFWGGTTRCSLANGGSLIRSDTCFGFGGTLTFLYLYRNYTLRGWFLFGGQKFLVMAIVTAVAFTGVLWEFFEGAWDLAHLDETSHVNAQAASLDTTIDILAETFASFLTMLGYVGINKLYEKNIRTNLSSLR